MPAELILTNGRIYAVEESAPKADAMAVRDGRILAVGRAADVARLAGPGSRVVDLRGRRSSQ